MTSQFARDAQRMQELSPAKQLAYLRTYPALSVIDDKPLKFSASKSYMKDSKVDQIDVDRMLNLFMQSDDPLSVQYRRSYQYREYWADFGEVVYLSPRALAVLRSRLYPYNQKAAVKPVKSAQTPRNDESGPKLKFTALSDSQLREIEAANRYLQAEKEEKTRQKREYTVQELKRYRYMLQQGICVKPTYFNPPETPDGRSGVSLAKPAEHKPNSLKYAEYIQNYGKDDYLNGRKIGTRSNNAQNLIKSAGCMRERFAARQERPLNYASFPSTEEVLNTVFQSVGPSNTQTDQDYYKRNFILSPEDLKEESDYEELQGGDIWGPTDLQ